MNGGVSGEWCLGEVERRGEGNGWLSIRSQSFNAILKLDHVLRMSAPVGSDIIKAASKVRENVTTSKQILRVSRLNAWSWFKEADMNGARHSLGWDRCLFFPRTTYRKLPIHLSLLLSLANMLTLIMKYVHHGKSKTRNRLS